MSRRMIRREREKKKGESCARGHEGEEVVSAEKVKQKIKITHYFSLFLHQIFRMRNNRLQLAKIDLSAEKNMKKGLSSADRAKTERFS